MAEHPQAGGNGRNALELERASRRRRSVAIALALAAAVLLFYVLTIVKMGPAVFDRSL